MSVLLSLLPGVETIRRVVVGVALALHLRELLETMRQMRQAFAENGKRPEAAK